MKIADHFYTLTETARIIGVERHTIWRWVKQGKPTPQKVGGVIFIDRKVVDDLAKAVRGSVET